ncbi:hypothetical protein [Anaerococcus rubeinfantis]|uniref:hypothetical protein n=1 Tax=Anaerococcus rubeinfantis TaxID=1720199 RepID=UPI00073F4E0D|nr:hypothetical protein [Anaerococcus rubeinfantis]
MNEKNYEKILNLRKELEELDKSLEKIKNKNSFFKFFTRSLLISFIFLLIGSIMKIQNSTKILLFVLVFILANLIQIILISKNQKKEIEKIKKKQIKIQAQIFALVKEEEN